MESSIFDVSLTLEDGSDTLSRNVRFKTNLRCVTSHKTEGFKISVAGKIHFISLEYVTGNTFNVLVNLRSQYRIRDIKRWAERRHCMIAQMIHKFGFI
jgi:hypothetical protein